MGYIVNVTLTKPVYIGSRREEIVLTYAYGLIALFATAFVYMTYRGSRLIDTAHAGVSSVSYFLCHLSIIAVEAVIWVILAKAGVRLKMYAGSVIDNPDGKALNYVANALLLGLLYAILFAMATAVKTLFVHTTYLKGVTTVTNLTPVAIIMLVSISLFAGSAKLNGILPARQRSVDRPVLAFSLAVFFFGAIVYAMYFDRVAPTLLDDDGLHHFALAPHTLLLIYVVPYVLVWLLGLLACLNLAHYARHVEGKIYRPLFRKLYIGLLLGFIGTYLLQVFTESNLTSNRFGVGLLVLVALLLMLVIGCQLIYRGTSNLYGLEQ